jgi:hypothetical protein
VTGIPFSMTEIDIKSVKMKKLANPKHGYRTFRLLWIQDINTKLGETHYKVLFQDINPKSSIYLDDDIFPEFLHDQFAIGLHYKKGILINTVAPAGKIIPVTITSTNNNFTQQISEVLSDSEYDLNYSFPTKQGPRDYTKYNKRQFCVVFENEKQIIIFPCAVIGARYYFTSSSMRHHLFAMKLDSLYEDIELDTSTRTAKILLRHSASSEDAPHILRFVKNEFAHKQWHAVHNSLVEISRKYELARKNSYFVPLKIDFPVQQTIQMEIRGFKFWDNNKNKEKILVFEIMKENSQFDFDTITIQRRVKNKLLGDRTVIETERFKTTALVKNTYPASRFKRIPIKPTDKRTNPNLDDIKVLREYLDDEYESVIDETVPLTKDIEPALGISVMESDGQGDNDTRPASVARQGEEEKDPKERKPREYFVLADFKKLMPHLQQQEEVTGMNISQLRYVPPKYQSRNRKLLSLKESYDKTLQNRRVFVCVSFKYKDKSVCLVEIDHDRLVNGPGTYVLTSDGGENPDSFADMVVRRFVKGEKFKKTETDLQALGINFGSKKHPSLIKKMSILKKENAFRRWVLDLFRKIMKKAIIDEDNSKPPAP